MAITRFRTARVTLTDTVNGIKITPTTIDSGFTATNYKFSVVQILDLITGTDLWIKAEVDDPWIKITGIIAQELKLMVDYIDSFYLKSTIGTATVGLIVYVVDQKQ